ncbi:MAG TPA: DUF202 domain-containing protein [Solirubrobacteraceae bacterium]|nr:DUF202 domain-containing protein [Solirubrobacteraceae bacterium]
MSPQAPKAHGWDEGAASERTLLAWERTAIASLAVAALVVRAGIVYSLLGLAIPIAAVLVLASVGEWLFSLRIYGEREQVGETGAVAHERVHAVLVGITLIAAAGSAALSIIR